MNSELMHFVFDISKFSAGILLAQSVLVKYESIDETVDKMAKWLSGFQGTIGGLAFGMGVIYTLFYAGCFVMDLAGVLSGMLLLGVSLRNIPAIGEQLTNASNYLKAFAIPIGIGALISGILGVFNLACF